MCVFFEGTSFCLIIFLKGNFEGSDINPILKTLAWEPGNCHIRVFLRRALIPGASSCERRRAGQYAPRSTLLTLLGLEQKHHHLGCDLNKLQGHQGLSANEGTNAKGWFPLGPFKTNRLTKKGVPRKKGTVHQVLNDSWHRVSSIGSPRPEAPTAGCSMAQTR